MRAYYKCLDSLISQSSLLKIQGKLTKLIKKWLNLPHCCTTAVVYHPDILKLVFLPQVREQAKLSTLSSLEFSSDPATKECLSLMKDPDFLRRLDIPSNTCKTHKSTVAVKKTATSYLKKTHSEARTASLDPLEVQSKFKDIISLEPQAHTWNRLLAGLPAGQLSFLLRAGSDCLPTPLNETFGIGICLPSL